MEDQFPDLTQSEVVSAEPQATDLPDLSNSEPMGTSIGREAVNKLAQWRQDPDKSPLLPHQASYLEAFGKLYDNEMALQSGQGFYERGVDTAKALDLKKAAAGFVDEFGKVAEHEKERAGQISDLRDPAALAKASLLLPWQSLRDTGVSGAKALAGLFPMTADLVSSGLQSQIGLAKSAHVISPESEQKADAALNASTDLLHGAVSSAGHKLDEVTGNDPQSLASVAAENITPLAVPIGGAEELSNALTKTTSNLPKYAAKAEQKIFETAAAATPLAAKAAKAGIGLAAGAALGHGIARGATNVLELLGAGLGFIKSPGAMTQALRANLSDLAQAAAIKAEADGPEVIDALWKHADQAAQTAKESADYMRKKLSPEEVKDLDWRAPSTGEPLAPEQLSPAARKVREAEAQIPDLQNKAETLRNTADNKRFFDRLAGISLDAGAHTLEGAAIGGAISGAGSVTGDKDALGQGVLLGGALGAAGGASKVPGEVRAAVREVNRSDLARRGESALPENHPLYEAHSQALASQPSYVKDYVNINSGLAASKGARAVVLKGADFVRALGDAGVEVDPSRPPAGEFDKSTNTAYVNVDHLGSGVVPHEITHAIDQATGLSKSGKFSQAFDAMMNSRDPADQEAIANARDKYEERLNKNLPPGSKKMTLTMDGLKEELAADLGSDLIHDVTPEGLYGGKSVTQRVEQHLRNLRNKIIGDKTGKTDTFGFPVTHEMREALLDELFNAGKKAKARKSESIPYEGAPLEAEAPAKPANPQTVQDAILALKKLGIPSPKAKVGEAINALGADAKVEDVVRNAINMMPGEDNPAINFMPSDHPDALDKPALRRKSDGKVFVAKNRATPNWMIPDQHPETKDRYQSGGYDRWEDGYVKNDGGFVDKKEGHKPALKTGRIDKGTKTEYKGSLSSLDLGENRNFMPSFEDGLTEVPKPPAQTKRGEGNYYKTTEDKLSGHAGEIMKERAALMNQDGFEVAQQDGSTKYYKLDRDKYLKNFMPSMEEDAEQHLVGQVREINNRLQGLVSKPNDPKYRELSDKKAALWKDIHKLRAGSVRDFGIIGSGPAGLGAAASAAYEGVDTVLLEKEIGVGGQPKNSSRIENLYGTQTEGITGPEMTRNALGKAKANGAEVRAGVGVKKLEYDPKTGVKTLTYSNGRKEQFKNVQISVGNEFRKLDVPGAEYAVNGNGRMAALEAKGGTLIVVGGGNSASQAALGAIEAGGVKKVLLFARSGLHGMSESQGQQIEAHPKIQVVNDEIARIDKDGKTLNVKTKGGDEYPVNAVGTFVGGKPKVDWLPKEIQLDNEGKIVTNSKGETSMPGVYAAGDARSGSTPRIAIASGHGSGVASEVSKKIWNEKNTQKSQTGLGGISLETTRNESISNSSGSTTPSEPQPVTTPTSSGNAEGATVNIRLDVKDGPRLKTSDVVSALRAKGVNIDGYVVHQSDTEPTFVAKLDRPLTPEEARSLSAELKQEAIAQHDGTKGELYGPGAENWKPFNPDYFLTENGKRLSEGSTNRPNNDLGAPPERSDSPAGSTQPEGQLNESNGLNQPKFMPAPPPASPEFQKWFKGSKVVDESGKPKIVLHGTAYDFNKFDKNKLGSSTNQVDTNLGFFFTEDPEGASYFSYFAGLKKKGVPGGDAYEIASEPDPKSVEGTGANIIPAVLSIQKPYVFKDYGAFDAQVFGALHSVFGISPDKESQNRQFVQSLKNQGYDGIRIKGGAHYMMGGEDAKGKDAWIAFEAQQVKSAIGNRGTWSSKNPNMNFMPAPHIEREASRLGLQYKGDDGDTRLFHDPITRTTIPLAQDSERGKLQEKLKAKRDQFQNGLRDVNFMPSAMGLAEKLHANDTRDGGSPYMDHIRAVHSGVSGEPQESIAALHDAVEHGHMTLDDVEAQFGKRVRDGVDSLTRRPDETYAESIARIAENPDAIPVKISDLNHNQPTAKPSMQGRYSNARQVLEDKITSNALSADKKEYVGAHRDLPEGTPIGVRIDIPAYERSGHYVQTIHEMARGNTVGKRIGYDGIVTLDNPTFMSNEKGAEKIRAGSAKFPVATVEGEYNPSREMPKDLAGWEPVGYNPKSHSYFYSKESGEPVVAGDKAISTGNTVYVKNPQFGNKGDFKFMPSTVEDAISRVPIYGHKDYADSPIIYGTYRRNPTMRVPSPDAGNALNVYEGRPMEMADVPDNTAPDDVTSVKFAKMENPLIVVGSDQKAYGEKLLPGEHNLFWREEDTFDKAKELGRDGVVALSPDALPADLRNRIKGHEATQEENIAIQKAIEKDPSIIDWEHRDNQFAPLGKRQIENSPGVDPDKILDRFNSGRITKEQMAASLADINFMPSPIEAAREKFSHGEKVAHDSDEHFWTKAWPEFLKATGATLSPKKESRINLAAERAVGDVRKFLDDNPKFKDYYNKDWDETRKALEDHYGRKITDDEMTFFKLATGLTSPHTSLQSNTGDAMGVFDQWLKDGHLDSIKMGVSAKGNRVLSESPVSISGTTNGIKAFTLKIVDKLSQDFGGPVKAANYLMEPVSAKELNDFKQSLGYKGKVGKLNSIKELVEQATGQSEKIPRMFIFGRKVGAYTLNLLGEHKYNTVDIWESRFIRSQFKGMFGEGRTGLPINADEHTLFSRFSDLFNEEFRKQTGMNMEASALQAARWFYTLSAVKAAGYTGATTSDTISHYVKEHIKKVQKKSDLSDVNIPEPDPLQ